MFLQICTQIMTWWWLGITENMCLLLLSLHLSLRLLLAPKGPLCIEGECDRITFLQTLLPLAASVMHLLHQNKPEYAGFLNMGKTAKNRRFCFFCLFVCLFFVIVYHVHHHKLETVEGRRSGYYRLFHQVFLYNFNNILNYKHHFYWSWWRT